ncbi:MAG: hypothetical protein KC777_24400 [Cyanobacteria bacterium HKST-UBA02]|nr:hypothetical protein [Cyanobacteria bacterium HKST-UBA02]
MKNLRLLLGACLAVLCLSGCAGRFVVGGPVGPGPVGPVVTVDVIDYWYDGYRYYYWDGDTGLYFWWSSGTRYYCNRGWAPRPVWHRHDHYWRDQDRGWRGGPVWNPGRGRGYDRYPPVIVVPPTHRRDQDHGWDRRENPNRGPVINPGRGRFGDGKGHGDHGSGRRH